MMKLKTFAFVLLWTTAGLSPALSQCPIIPQPTSYREEAGNLDLRSLSSVVVEDESFREIGHYLQTRLLTYKGIALPEAVGGQQDRSIFIGRETGMPEEGYRLEVTASAVRITASRPHGAFNGVVSLLQLARLSATGQIRSCRIEDHPAMRWRGIMLDESRHFFGTRTVKQLLDWMAFYKLDRFHWHLTDAPGWRIQILRYPRLALVGGIGNKTDSTAPASYYTQQDIEDIVRYARERFITIVPEIDMPGHAAAANRAYPEFSGGGSETHPEFTFNPGKEGTYGYLTGILREVNVLFPSGLIHIGGDEVSFGNGHWTSFPGVQKLMSDQGLKDATDVERYFVQRMADSVISLGSKVLGWDEIAKSDLPQDHTIIFWWRHDKPATLRESLNKNYEVVLCPRIPFYFDFVQSDRDLSGRRWKGAFSAEKAIYEYSVENYPDIVTAANSHLVIGLQADLWSELIASRDRLQYMLFPRIAALAEAAWTPAAARRDYDGFVERVALQNHLYLKEHIKFYNLQHPDRTPEIIDVPVKQ